jgi:serine phosphatase RsbU (regulator of sigma subunit)
MPLPNQLLHSPLVEVASLSIPCKKPGRLILELRRTQEQLRILRADRERQAEYRTAVIQQYQFLGNFLRQQSDLLPRRGDRLRQRFTPEVSCATMGRENSNGDRCIWFPGPGCKYYILICDGMGTGLGAAQEGQSAASLLRQMLSAGFPAEHALRSLNSLTVLRGRAGAVTVDLAEIQLDSGRAAVYKWGAAPSYLIRDGGAEKIGTAGPPPGLSIKNARETVQRLSLRRGEVLILLSDGVDGEGALRRIKMISTQPPGELAAKVLEFGARNAEDDATVAAVRLFPGTTST